MAISTLSTRILKAVSGLVVVWSYGSSTSTLGLQSQQQDASRSSRQQQRQQVQQTPLLDHQRLVETIRSGRVYQHEDFLSEEQVLELLDEIDDLESSGRFETKGLSNSAYGTNQKFSRRSDRSICPVPWFGKEILEYKSTGHFAKDFPNTVAGKIRQMQHEVSDVLNRPTIILGAAQDIHHEGYFSLSKVGSFLPRHMDERHEEMKGAQGWLLPSRRSLSWLIYLSTPRDWDIVKNGGCLRTFPQKRQQQRSYETIESTNEGDLQVGWLNDEQSDKLFAVYMDAFYAPSLSSESSSSTVSVPVSENRIVNVPTEPHCILYTVINADVAYNTTGSDTKGVQRQYLTRPWLTESLQGIAVPDFLKACAEQDGKDQQRVLFTSQSIARQFSLIEDRRRWSDDDGNNNDSIPAGSVAEDIAPIRGSLVIFDSVQLPHEVLEMKSGIRMALAGWWHEKTQEFPASWGSIDGIGGEEL